jgi:hypothetical protein
MASKKRSFDSGSTNIPTNSWNNTDDGNDANHSTPFTPGDSGRSSRGGSYPNNSSTDSLKLLAFTNEIAPITIADMMCDSDLMYSRAYDDLHSDFVFTITPTVDKIMQQSSCFSSNLMAQGISAYQISGRRSYTDQIQLFADVYLYSLIKTLYAIKSNLTRGSLCKTLIFRGHAFLYRMCVDGSSIYNGENGISVSRRIAINENQIDSILNVLEKQFIIAKYARSCVDLDGNVNIYPMENVLYRMSTGGLSLKGNNQLMVMNNPDTFVHSTLLEPATSPLGNCFYSPAGTTLFVCSHGKLKIQNFSYIINKASFVTFSSYGSNFTSDKLSPPNFMSAKRIGIRDNLLSSEVKFVTGLDCNVPSRDDMPEYFYPRLLSDLNNRFNREDFGINPEFFQSQRDLPIDGEEPEI